MTRTTIACNTNKKKRLNLCSDVNKKKNDENSNSNLKSKLQRQIDYLTISMIVLAA